MPFPLQIATSSAAGALITLIGVFVGSVLSGRTQRRLWNRSKQIDVCADILSESTRVYHAMAAKWRRGVPIDWVTWNQALAAIWLVGEPEVVEAALSMDKTFWKQNARINRGEMTEESWAAALDTIDADRLRFANTVRVHVSSIKTRLTAIPTGRTVLLQHEHTEVDTPATDGSA
ncbi:hypothetical protein [Amycolatopsis sp. CA-126428]|uniref:hypothetical protein n=1 Tax=Amycolatopsis sp. CA-126428 TaxID=2073158 RepID=UPI0011B07961|nr:hypothetical protein [Amycolatopsis sp. CA-126428]